MVLPIYEVRLVDDDDNEVPVGETGEITQKTPGIGKRPELR